MILNDFIFFLDYKLLDLYVPHNDISRYYNIYTFFLISIFISIFFLGVNLANAGKEIKYALKERTITIVSQEVNLLFIVGLFLIPIIYSILAIPWLI